MQYLFEKINNRNKKFSTSFQISKFIECTSPKYLKKLSHIQLQVCKFWNHFDALYIKYLFIFMNMIIPPLKISGGCMLCISSIQSMTNLYLRSINRVFPEKLLFWEIVFI